MEFKEKKKRETLEKIALLHQQQQSAAAAPRHLPPNLPPVTAEDLAAAPTNLVRNLWVDNKGVVIPALDPDSESHFQPFGDS